MVPKSSDQAEMKAGSSHRAPISWVPVGLKVIDILYTEDANDTGVEHTPASTLVKWYMGRFSNKILESRFKDKPGDDIKASIERSAWGWFNFPSNNVRIYHSLKAPGYANK